MNMVLVVLTLGCFLLSVVCVVLAVRVGELEALTTTQTDTLLHLSNVVREHIAKGQP